MINIEFGKPILYYFSGYWFIFGYLENDLTIW